MRTSVTIAGGLASLVLFGSLASCAEVGRPVTGADAGPAAEATTDLPAGLDAEPTTGASPEPPPDAEPVPPPAPSPAAPAAAAAAALLQAASGGDGDSWKDTGGKEYRLGLVNTPETGECYGSVATAKRKELTAGGFRAEIYTVDTYGRSVSLVTLADGRNLNIFLARSGFANDKFLEQFRSENRALAAQLDEAFAAAKAERAGLWGACAGSTATGAVAAPAPAPVRSSATGAVAPPAPAPAPVRSSAPVRSTAPAATGNCHPDYSTCIPVKGTGSGSGEVNDLDCPDIGKVVQLRQVGVDPYRLDNNSDGVGCESYA